VTKFRDRSNRRQTEMGFKNFSQKKKTFLQKPAVSPNFSRPIRENVFHRTRRIQGGHAKTGGAGQRKAHSMCPEKSSKRYLPHSRNWIFLVGFQKLGPWEAGPSHSIFVGAAGAAPRTLRGAKNWTPAKKECSGLLSVMPAEGPLAALPKGPRKLGACCFPASEKASNSSLADLRGP